MLGLMVLVRLILLAKRHILNSSTLTFDRENSAVALGWGREHLTRELGESGMKRFGQNERRMSAPPN